MPVFAALVANRFAMVAPLLPASAPCWGPLGRALAPPVSPLRRWRAVVAHGHGEDRPRNELGRHDHPGPVVPGRHVPPTVGEDVVLPAVEEIVGLDRRRIHDRSGRDHDQVRRGRNIDPDIHADLGRRRARRPHDGRYGDHSKDHPSKHGSVLLAGSGRSPPLPADKTRQPQRIFTPAERSLAITSGGDRERRCHWRRPNWP